LRLVAIFGAICFGVLPTAVEGCMAGETVRSDKPAMVLRPLVVSGQAAPVGGSFDRFEIAGQAIPAPSNRNGDVAFFASLVRNQADEGVFIAVGDRIRKLAAVGDVIPSGERIADFTDHPALALNEAGAVAFPAALAGGRATAGVFIVADGKLDPAALSGAAAPDVAGGSLTSFEWPVLDDSSNLVFLASVRRGRGSSDAIFLYRGGELRKLVAAGDDAPGGGIFSGFGAPAMNNHTVVAFPAIVEQGPVLAVSTSSIKGKRAWRSPLGTRRPTAGSSPNSPSMWQSTMPGRSPSARYCAKAVL